MHDFRDVRCAMWVLDDVIGDGLDIFVADVCEKCQSCGKWVSSDGFIATHMIARG
jgi:hypothetical protein